MYSEVCSGMTGGDGCIYMYVVQSVLLNQLKMISYKMIHVKLHGAKHYHKQLIYSSVTTSTRQVLCRHAGHQSINRVLHNAHVNCVTTQQRCVVTCTCV